jgi:hypothetical protein
MQRLMQKLVWLMVALSCVTACGEKDWRTASRAPAGLAPDPAQASEAVVQVYAARAWGWRGWFAVHTWIATKPGHASAYTVYEVIGWRQNRGLPVLRIEQDIPDRLWFGEQPQLLADRRGKDADALVEAIDKAAHAYPWPETYDAFPGPKSNTFTAWIARQVPELGLKLPFTAIGSGYVN